MNIEKVMKDLTNYSESSYYDFESRQMVFYLYVDCKIPNLILQIRHCNKLFFKMEMIWYNTALDVTDTLMGSSREKY